MLFNADRSVVKADIAREWPAQLRIDVRHYDALFVIATVRHCSRKRRIKTVYKIKNIVNILFRIHILIDLFN